MQQPESESLTMVSSEFQKTAPAFVRVNPRDRRLTRQVAGFSLIELLIALAILAAVTTIAIRATSGLQSQARYQATARSLTDIQNAIIGPSNERGPDGSAVVSGFVADTGRLPNYLISANDPLGATNGDPLNELLAQNSIPTFGFYQPNTDKSVLVGVGWKGPYMRLAAGPTYIRDGWGNSFHVYDASGNLLNTTGSPIAQISSWAADKVADTNHGGTGDTAGYDADISIPNASNLISGGFVANAALYGRVIMDVGSDSAPSSNAGGTSGPVPNVTYTAPTGTPTGAAVSVWVCYFGPDLTSSPNPVVDLPVEIYNASPPSGAAVNYNWQFVMSGLAYTPPVTLPPASVVDSRVTIGPRVLKAYVFPSSVYTVATFRSAVSTGSPAAYAVATLNFTANSGPQTVPNLVLPHYSP
jgi:prepilin-type N-terminal cleavage/methylation domain-containing protein